MAISVASEVFDTARGFLNDINADIWTNTVLLTRLPHAHRELQLKLRNAACPVMMKSSAAITVNSGALTVTLPSDLVEPIQAWENSVGGGKATATPMTESNPLLQATQTTTLNYWEWDGANINLIGATANRDVFLRYWRRIAIPTGASDSIGIWDGELYLAPRVAAIAAGSVGQAEMMAALTELADSALSDIITSNKGRGTATSEGSIKP